MIVGALVPARVVGGFLGSCVVSFLPGLWAFVFVGGFVLFGLLPVPIFIGEVLSVFSLPGCWASVLCILWFGIAPLEINS